MRSRPFGLATAILALSLAACAGPAADTPPQDSSLARDTPSNAATTPTTDPTDAESSGGADQDGGAGTGGSGAGSPSDEQRTRANGGSNGNQADAGFAYVPWGPDDPPIPQHYASLAGSGTTAPDCAALAATQPGGTFWTTAIAVCRAITGEGEWPTTASVPSPPAAPNAYEACLDAELAAMLHRALAWHAKYPGREPTVAYPADTAVSPCQVRIYELRVLDESDPSYPGEDASGRVAVTVTAAGATEDSVVTVDGHEAEVVSADPQAGVSTLVFLTTPGAEPRTAAVGVKTPRAILAGTVQLPGAPSAEGSPGGEEGTPEQGGAPSGGGAPGGEGSPGGEGVPGGGSPGGEGTTSDDGASGGSQDTPNGQAGHGETGGSSDGGAGTDTSSGTPGADDPAAP